MSASTARSRRLTWAWKRLTKPHRNDSRSSASWVPSRAMSPANAWKAESTACMASSSSHRSRLSGSSGPGVAPNSSACSQTMAVGELCCVSYMVEVLDCCGWNAPGRALRGAGTSLARARSAVTAPAAGAKRRTRAVRGLTVRGRVTRCPGTAEGVWLGGCPRHDAGGRRPIGAPSRVAACAEAGPAAGHGRPCPAGPRPAGRSTHRRGRTPAAVRAHSQVAVNVAIGDWSVRTSTSSSESRAKARHRATSSQLSKVPWSSPVVSSTTVYCGG